MPPPARALRGPSARARRDACAARCPELRDPLKGMMTVGIPNHRFCMFSMRPKVKKNRVASPKTLRPHQFLLIMFSTIQIELGIAADFVKSIRRTWPLKTGWYMRANISGIRSDVLKSNRGSTIAKKYSS